MVRESKFLCTATVALFVMAVFVAMFAYTNVAYAADTILRFENGKTAILHDNGTITGECHVESEWSDPAGDGTTENFTKVEVTMPDGQLIKPWGNIADACAGPEVGCTRPGDYPFKATPRPGEEDWYDVFVNGYDTRRQQNIHHLKWHVQTVGWGTVTKKNSNPTVTANNSYYGSIEDAVFTVYKGSKSQGTIRYRNGAWTELELPRGNYRMEETTTPKGFKTAPAQTFTITSGETTKVPWVNEPIPSRVYVNKLGATGNATLDARVASNPYYDLSGAEFTLYKSKNTSDRARNFNNELFTLKVTKQSDGSYKTNTEEMPAGVYYIRETKAPNSGYQIDTDGDGICDNEDANPTDYWRSITLPPDNKVHSIDWNNPPFFPEVDLTKNTSKADMNLFEAVKDNPCYSILGAEFTLYETNGNVALDINNKPVVLTINSSEEQGTVGKTDKVKILPGDYWLRETKAPERGFRLDADGDGVSDEVEEILGRDTSGHKDVRVVLEDQTFTWADIPLLDPEPLYLLKRDATTGKYFKVPQGEGDLNGAQYRISYYKGVYTRVDQLPSTPDTTAVWETRSYVENGRTYSGCISLRVDAPVSGVWKYTSGGDNYAPLGTLVIQEISAPTGYLVDSNRYILTMTDDGAHLLTAIVHQPYQQDGTPGNDDWNNFANQYQLNGDRSGVDIVP